MALIHRILGDFLYSQQFVLEVGGAFRRFENPPGRMGYPETRYLAAKPSQGMVPELVANYSKPSEKEIRPCGLQRSGFAVLAKPSPTKSLPTSPPPARGYFPSWGKVAPQNPRCLVKFLLLFP